MDKFWKWMRKHRYVIWDDGELYFKGSLLEATSAPKQMLVGFIREYLHSIDNRVLDYKIEYQDLMDEMKDQEEGR